MLDKYFKETDLCKKVWEEKYLMSDENLPSDRVKKIVKEVNMPELEELINAGRFLPAGRILYGLGRNTNVTYMNCYVTEILEDSVHGIFNTAEKIAEIYKTGGGVGLALTPLRPTNSYVNNAAEKTSGSVSFASIYNEVTKVIGMKNRRGALILLEDCQHPDIFEFVSMKDDNTKSQVTSANISVIIRDDFMLAVQEDKDWDLWYPYETSYSDDPFTVKTINACYDYPDKNYFYVESDNTYRKKVIVKTIKAKELWNEIVKRAHSSAEPGLFFIDTVKYDHTVEKFTPIVGSNPCGEVPLPNNGACNLGAINLSQYIKHKFTPEAYFDEDLFIEDVRKAVRFLDKIVDLNIGRNALNEQDKLLTDYRRLGLGVMGFADMLAYMQIPYDSPSAFRLTEDVFDLLETVAWQESLELAKELGAFKAFDPTMLEQGHLRSIIEKGVLDYEETLKYGIRNASLLSIAPTGSIALLAQCSSGIEPIFALDYTRNSDSLSQASFKVYHQAYKEYLDTGKSDIPNFFKTAYKINPNTRVKLQGLIQSYIDSSISVTINLPKNATIKDIEQIYEIAWEFGCKGITVYREGSRSQILVAGEDNEVLTDLRDRYDILEGKTVVVPYKQKIYLTANYNPVNNKIVEVFISSAKSGSDIRAIYEGYGRLLSLYLQEGGEIDNVIKTLIDIRGEESVFTKNGIYHSLPDVIAKSLIKLANISISEKAKCPECGAEIITENGCMSCKNCGYSLCN